MSKLALRVKVFGVCLLILGIGLILLPNLILSVFGVPPSSEVGFASRSARLQYRHLLLVRGEA